MSRLRRRWLRRMRRLRNHQQSQAQLAGVRLLMKSCRLYQEQGLQEFGRAWRAGKRRGVCVAPTASGKTFFAMTAAKRAIERGKRVLFIADRRLLIAQCSDEAEGLGIDLGLILAGCM